MHPLYPQHYSVRSESNAKCTRAPGKPGFVSAWQELFPKPGEILPGLLAGLRAGKSRLARWAPRARKKFLACLLGAACANKSWRACWELRARKNPGMPSRRRRPRFGQITYELAWASGVAPKKWANSFSSWPHQYLKLPHQYLKLPHQFLELGPKWVQSCFYICTYCIVFH